MSQRNTDWQVGDLAVCVDDGRCSCCGGKFFDAAKVYQVSSLLHDGELWLGIAGVPHGLRQGVWSADSFRKIRPDEHETCEEEFVTLLKLSKQRVSA